MTSTGHRRLYWGAPFYLLAAFLAACSSGGGGRPAALPAEEQQRAAAPVAPAALAEAESTNPRLRIQVLGVSRSGPEAVTVTLRLINPDATAPVSIGDAFGDAAGDGSISGVYLVDQAGLKKAFILRDDRGQPQCSTGLGPLPPGAHVEVWARYPLPAGGAARVTVKVPGLAAFRDLPVADAPRGTGSAGSSY